MVNVDNSALIGQKKSEIDALIARGINQKNLLISVEAELQNLKENKLKFDDKNTKLIKKSTLEVTLLKKREEYVDVRNMINNLKQHQEAIEHNNKIDTRLNVLKEIIRTEEQIKCRLISEIEGYKREISMLTKQISEHELN